MSDYWYDRDDLDEPFAATTIDWRELFSRYVEHVWQCEGTNFLDCWEVGTDGQPRGFRHSDIPLTQEEHDAIAELVHLIETRTD